MTDLKYNRVVRTLAERKRRGQKTLLPFLTAGYPDLDTLLELLCEIQRRGAVVCELGLPFSDPIADGPTIQASYTEALEGECTVQNLFRAISYWREGISLTEGLNRDLQAMLNLSIERIGLDVKMLSLLEQARIGSIRELITSSEKDLRAIRGFTDEAVSDLKQSLGQLGLMLGLDVDEPRPAKQDRQPGQMGLLAMVSYSIVYRYGPERFCGDAAEAGIDGLIVPDLPLEEAGALASVAAEHDLCLVLLVAPTTPPERRIAIARRSTGFVYFMSVAGITGERTELPPQTIQAVGELREHTDTPICVGFGVSSPELVREVCKTADGAIVGSAIIHRITDALERRTPRADLVREVGEFVETLLEPTR